MISITFCEANTKHKHNTEAYIFLFKYLFKTYFVMIVIYNILYKIPNIVIIHNIYKIHLVLKS